MVRFRW